MSIELTARAELALWALGGRECEWEGGPIGPNGKCGNDFCAHCPICFANAECVHEVYRWDDSFGYSGPEFPAPLEDDEPILQVPRTDIDTLFGNLAPLWDVYVEHVGEPSLDLELLDQTISLLELPVIGVSWENSQSMCGSIGTVYFAEDAAAVFDALKSAIERVRAAFDQLRPATEEVEDANR